jgi:hypothetical protein
MMNVSINEMSQRIARSTVAIIDTMVQRGAARGEELTTLGQLRDQCVSLVSAIEAEQAAGAETTEAAPEGEKPTKK